MYDSINGSPKFKVVFRYDDYFLENDKINENIINKFVGNDIPIVLGIIPCMKNEKIINNINKSYLDFLIYNIKEHNIEIALHGLTHSKMTPFGEFKGLSFEEQNRRINKGKHILDSILKVEIVTFIPPWNAHDLNTVKALKLNDIFIVSSSVYDVWGESIFYPMTIDNINQLNVVVNSNQIFGGVIVVMLHKYNFLNSKSINELSKTLKVIKSNKNVGVYTFKELYKRKIFINKIQNNQQINQNLLTKFLNKKGILISSYFIAILNLLNLFLYFIIIFLVYYFASKKILIKQKLNLLQLFIVIIYSFIIIISILNYWLGPIKLLITYVVFTPILVYFLKLINMYNKVLTFQIKRQK